jgi:glycerol-3-phosphate dehydrogenase subunit C
MAGTNGFKRGYYESSMNIGGALSERINEVGADVVATDCGGCKLQIEQLANVEVIHPIIILDKTYFE